MVSAWCLFFVIVICKYLLLVGLYVCLMHVCCVILVKYVDDDNDDNDDDDDDDDDCYEYVCM